MALNTYSHVYHNDGACPCFLNIAAERMESFRYSFIDIVQKDSPGQTFGFSTLMQNVSCFDLDQAVKSLGGNNQSSMDCIIRTSTYDAVHQKFYNPKWLLVELKLNSEEAQQDRMDLKKKVTETECGLSGLDIDISRNFIYPESIWSQKRSLFAQWQRGSGGSVFRNWSCYSPALFEQFLLFQENLPYKPENNHEHILQSFSNCANPDKFDKQMRYWLSRTEHYQKNGNRYEHDHILTSLSIIFYEFLDSLEPSDDKDLLCEYWNFLEKYKPIENNN